MNQIIRIATRKSPLAIKQCDIIINELHKYFPDIITEITPITTKGDKILDKPLKNIGGKGLFITELENALANNEADICIHSLKDLPYDLNPDFPIVAFSKREDPSDVMVYSKSKNNDVKPIGTSSPRREYQLKMLYKNIIIKSIRGNVKTRIDKIDSGEYSSGVFAKAGLIRLGYEKRIGKIFSYDEMVPAAGQGIIAIQARKGEFSEIFEKINCKKSEIEAISERNIIKNLGGDCSSPIAAFANIKYNNIIIRGYFFDGSKNKKCTLHGSVHDYINISNQVANNLLS